MSESGQSPNSEPVASEPGFHGVQIDYTLPPKGDAAVDRWAHRRTEPRAFAAFWLIYLVAIFGVSAGGAGSLGLVAFDIYRAVARTAMVLVAIGIGVLWPLVRLSQARPDRIWRSAIADYFVIVLPLAMVCLPQSLGWLADWPLDVTLRLWACFAAWSILVAVLIATAQRRSWAPWVAMVFTLLVCFGGGVLVLLGNSGSGSADPAGAVDAVAVSDMLSIPTAAIELTRDRSWTGMGAAVTGRHWLVVVPPAAMALICGLYGVFAPAGRRA